jgi:hypothetical protein
MPRNKWLIAVVVVGVLFLTFAFVSSTEALATQQLYKIPQPGTERYRAVRAGDVQYAVPSELLIVPLLKVRVKRLAVIHGLWI